MALNARNIFNRLKKEALPYIERNVRTGEIIEMMLEESQ